MYCDDLGNIYILQGTYDCERKIIDCVKIFYKTKLSIQPTIAELDISNINWSMKSRTRNKPNFFVVRSNTI